MGAFRVIVKIFSGFFIIFETRSQIPISLSGIFHRCSFGFYGGLFIPTIVNLQVYDHPARPFGYMGRMDLFDKVEQSI